MLSNIYGNHYVALRIGFVLAPRINLLPKSDFSSDTVVVSFCLSVNLCIYKLLAVDNLAFT